MKKRLIFPEILAQKNSNKISIILGPRQVGKTTILQKLQQKLGGIFLDLDIFSNYEKISTYEKFVNYLKINGYRQEQNELFYIFLDEFQRYSDLSIVMKNIYDHHKNIKIFASGSSSLKIKNSIQESLAGRKRITHIYPLSFTEFLIFKERPDLIEKLTELDKFNKIKYHDLIPEIYDYLNEFIIFGGYPEVVLCRDKKEKINILRDIFDLFIKKDLMNFLHPKMIESANMLIEQLAINNGSMANYSTYGMKANISSKSIKNYIKLLEETFIILKLRPYFVNKNKEISKAPKVYFLDNGVRNYFINNFNDLKIRNDAGTLFEAYYIAELIKYNRNVNYQLKYYRTKIGSEVDVVIDKVSEIIPVEVKYKKNIKESDQRGIKNFIKNNKIKQAFLVNLSEVNKSALIKIIDCFNIIKINNS